jgi:BirA family biotin operon repressor/biotin-[acetyl-CoA-carboxylase] ligase
MVNALRESALEKSISELISQSHAVAPLVFCYNEVTSVLDLAKELAHAGVNTRSLILAKSQTAGRGQHGRSWVAVEEAFLGCLLFPQTTVAKQSLPAFSLVIALQIAKILLEYGVDVGVKWPNDILTKKERKKICGILLESDLVETSAGSSLSLRVGIGVNLVGNPEEGSSIKKEIDRAISLDQFAAKVTENCVTAYYVFERDGFTPFKSSWNELDLLMDREIKFQHGDKVLQGKVCGVDSLGRIVFRVGGEELSFNSGQII